MVQTRRRFGQHFLEPAWVRKVVDAVAPEPGQTFLEIGPGPGGLTLALADRGARIVAVEIDRDLAAALARRAPPMVMVVAGDFLDTDVPQLLAGLEPLGRARAGGARVRVAGNLPYNASSPILFRLLELQRTHALFSDAAVMLQREVAVRVTARPGSKDYGVLSILVQALADARVVLHLPPGAFRPVPKVHSAVVRLTFGASRVVPADPALFEAMVRALFTRRRKILLNALRPFATARGAEAGAVLTQAALDPGRRPETLHLDELHRLADRLGGARHPAKG